MIARRILLLAAAAALSACGGPSGLSPLKALPLGHGVSPLATPIPFNFTTVDDPASNVNKVTAINNAAEIVGTIGVDGSPSDPLSSYSSTPSYSTFTPIKYSTAKATVATGLNNLVSKFIIIGWVDSPPSLRGIWGFVDVGGIITLYKDHKEGKGSLSVTQLLGLNDSEFGVGYYTNPYGNNVPVVLNIPGVKWTLLKPPGYNSAEGTGINDNNDIVGWETTSSGTLGFFVRAGTYYSVAYPKAKTTEAMGINSSDQIVGWYVDTTGATHGFIESNPTANQPSWQEIDVPNGVNGTFVTGINDSDDVCGYYIDAAGVQHGFVATP
jgi:hypothetical protein